MFKKVLLFIFFLLFLRLPVFAEELIQLEARIDVPLELNLEKALNLAIENNLEILSATHEKEINRWKFRENIGGFLPDYKLGLSDQRFNGSFLIGGIVPTMTSTSFASAYMRLEHTIFAGGKGIFNTLSSKNIYKSSKENLLAFSNNTLLSVTKAYNNLLQEQAKLDVLEKGIEEAKSKYELNKNLEKEGVGTHFDVLQSEVQLIEQEQEYIKEQASFRNASIALSRLLNLDLGTHIKPDSSDLTLKDFMNIELPIEEIIETAKKNRPDIKKVNYEYSALRNNIGIAFSYFLPEANIFGQYGGVGNVFFHRTKIKEVTPDAILLNDAGNPIVQTIKERNVSNVVDKGGSPFALSVDDSLKSNTILGISLDWDILDGFSLPAIARVHQARHRAKIEKINLENINKKIEEEIRSAYLNVQVNKKLIGVGEKRVEAAREALKLAKARLENGVGINTELLNAQKQYASALASRVDALVEYNNAQAELLHATGLISVERLVGR